MAGWRTPSARELGLVAAMIVPLAVVGTVIAQIPVDAYSVTRDPPRFVARSLRIAHNWASIVEIVDPPLRYTPFVLLYTLVEPSPPLAKAIGAALGVLNLYVAVPLTAWACFRTIASPRVGLAVLAALVAGWLDVLVTWPDAMSGWQYHIVLLWVFGALVAVDWTLDATDSRQRYRRAAITGVLIGGAGLTQVLFAAILTAAVVVAFLVARRVRALVVTGLSGLPFAGYYLISDAARKWLFTSTAKRDGTESLLPVTSGELLIVVGIVATLMLWYGVHERGPEAGERRALGAAAFVSGGFWIAGVLVGSSYLNHFVPILAYPLVAAAAADVAFRVAEPRRWQLFAGSPATDGGRPTTPLVERLSWRAFALALATLALTLTMALLIRVPPQYPGFS